jgi:hypothetical protein
MIESMDADLDQKRSPCEDCNEPKITEGYVTIFINSNGTGIFKDGHAAVFVGRLSDGKRRLLFDPCGYYAQGKGYVKENPKHKVFNREGPVFEGDQFDYRDYYLYHRSDGPKVNAYSFEITKKEEEQIRENIMENAEECYAECTTYVKTVLRGIEPFREVSEILSPLPSSLGNALKKQTKLPITNNENDIIKRMRGIK